MKAVVLLGTLKKDEMSNTEALSQFFCDKIKPKAVDCEIIKLTDNTILPGTYSNMGAGDDWPKILTKILDAQIIIFATPIWWGGHSSEMQRVIERLDEIHDNILKGKKSPLEGKVSGIIISGDSDGAQHVIGNLSNFFNAIGLLLPPYATLSVLWEGQAKNKSISLAELMQKYQDDYSDTADTMVEQILKFAKKI